MINTTNHRFSRLAKKGIWEKIFKILAEDSDNEYVMIDSTTARAHQHSAGARKKNENYKPVRPLGEAQGD